MTTQVAINSVTSLPKQVFGYFFQVVMEPTVLVLLSERASLTISRSQSNESWSLILILSLPSLSPESWCHLHHRHFRHHVDRITQNFVVAQLSGQNLLRTFSNT
jgi:hypothetical protein